MRLECDSSGRAGHDPIKVVSRDEAMLASVFVTRVKKRLEVGSLAALDRASAECRKAA